MAYHKNVVKIYHPVTNVEPYVIHNNVLKWNSISFTYILN